MSGIDLVGGIVLIFCTLLGLSWGLIRQVLAVVGLIAGLVLATAYHQAAAALLSSYISDPTLGQTIGFVLILVAVTSLVGLFASLLQRLAGLLFLGWLDHLIGGALGLLQGAIICSVALLVLQALPGDVGKGLIAESQLAQPLLDTVGSVIIQLLPASLRIG